MGKVIKVINKNGTYACVRKDLQGKEDSISLCSMCPKKDVNSRFKNCHISNKVYELELLFGLKLPVLECSSYIGEVETPKDEDVNPQQTEKDSTEDE